MRVYKPSQLRRMLREAGLTDVYSRVGVFNPIDTPLSDVIERRTRLLDRRSVLERIGRIGGWYVMGVGRRPR